ncbi:MAG: glycosyltransferase family 4 protein [Chitinophagaceae bacterium]
MKKVLLVNDFESGGGAEGVFWLTARLLTGLHEVYTYTAYCGFEESGSNPLGYIYSRKHFCNIRKIILDKDIGIVHVHNFRWISPSVFGVARWLRKHHDKEVKFFLTAHDYLLACPNVAYGYYDRKKVFVRYAPDRLPGLFLFRQMDQHGWKHSLLKKVQWYLAFRFLKLQKEIDLVIAPSVFLKNVLQLNNPGLPATVIRNPVSSDRHYNLEALSIKKRFDDVVRLVYFGRIASEKGTDKLLEMLSKIKNRITFHLDIYGTGSFREYIPSMIQNLGLGGKVDYHGFKPFDEIRAALPNYDAFVMSSIWYENAPLSIVEAAMAGLAIITPDMGGMKELAELCGDCWFYDLHDCKSLMACIQNISTTVIAASHNRAAKTLHELFSEEKYIAALQEVYEENLAVKA